MSLNFTDIRESFRNKGTKINISVLVITGKDGDHFVVTAPSVLVSGYGTTINEANDSFSHNMELFFKDFLELSVLEREKYLIGLGFIKEKYKNKNYSRLYVDENGVLQGLEHSTIKTLQTTI